MKLTIFTLLTAAVLTACTGTASQKKTAADTAKNHKIAKQYTCTMHPEVLAGKPGVCPKCGMELVEKEK